eukprot:TRINITY_DN2002_c0_g1_i3.p1 TRINITY_DN2002_c0_g1~~TRINITY_DN2002_c0_g1_i3.p1  ORF type:complete len:967 (-),score=93.24 TRINITY_DN2002_c0_g1_i3:13-2913(-)
MDGIQYVCSITMVNEGVWLIDLRDSFYVNEVLFSTPVKKFFLTDVDKHEYDRHHDSNLNNLWMYHFTSKYHSGSLRVLSHPPTSLAITYVSKSKKVFYVSQCLFNNNNREHSRLFLSDLHYNVNGGNGDDGIKIENLQFKTTHLLMYDNKTTDVAVEYKNINDFLMNVDMNSFVSCISTRRFYSIYSDMIPTFIFYYHDLEYEIDTSKTKTYKCSLSGVPTLSPLLSSSSPKSLLLETDMKLLKLLESRHRSTTTHTTTTNYNYFDLYIFTLLKSIESSNKFLRNQVNFHQRTFDQYLLYNYVSGDAAISWDEVHRKRISSWIKRINSTKVEDVMSNFDEESCIIDRSMIEDVYDVYQYKDNSLSFNTKSMQLKVLTINDRHVETDSTSYDLSTYGFYEIKSLILFDTSKLQSSVSTKSSKYCYSYIDLQFDIPSPRGNPEWGLIPWNPRSLSNVSTLNNKNLHVEIYMPSTFVDGRQVPLVIQLQNKWKRWKWKTSRSRIVGYDSKEAKQSKQSNDHELLFKRGYANIMISSHEVKTMEIGRGEQQKLHINTGIEHSELDSFVEPQSYTVTSSVQWNNRNILIKNDLIISESVELTISPCSTILLGNNVNIILSEKSKLHLLPCTKNNKSSEVQYMTTLSSINEDLSWGGFILMENSLLILNDTLITHSGGGFHRDGKYNLIKGTHGHRREQALFSLNQGSQVSLNRVKSFHNRGQVFSSNKAKVTISHSYFSQFSCGGEIYNGITEIENSCFSDFPTDGLSEYTVDEDNDAIYISGGETNIFESVFMNAKDDCIDSGSGPGGLLTVKNSLIESCFHEGVAINHHTGNTKNVQLSFTIINDCQQGYELGTSQYFAWVRADNCLFVDNEIGVRYGDNYVEGLIDGKMTIEDSVFVNNRRDVWNFVRSKNSPGNNLELFNCITDSGEIIQSLYNPNNIHVDRHEEIFNGEEIIANFVNHIRNLTNTE